MTCYPFATPTNQIDPPVENALRVLLCGVKANGSNLLLELKKCSLQRNINLSKGTLISPKEH
jgi:hypothetical protein